MHIREVEPCLSPSWHRRREEILPRLASFSRVPACIWQENGLRAGELNEAIQHWTDFDFSGFERGVSELQHYNLSIFEQNIHFVRVCSEKSRAIPILFLHGWPGSFLETVKIASFMTEQGNAAPGFDCICPSLPGFAFSTPLTKSPTLKNMTDDMLGLMTMLGHERFYIHGGDWGSVLAQSLAARSPERVRGIHLTFLPTPPPDTATFSGEDEQRAERMRFYMKQRAPYWLVQSDTPDTLGLALDDSPVGLLSWLGDRFLRWADERLPTAFQALVETATLYWCTGCAGTSAHIYHANRRMDRMSPPTTPVGVAVMPRDLVLPIRALAERRFNVRRWTELQRGGHFPGFEVPQSVANDLKTFIGEIENAR
ncbi:epoxide hydrolase family protein [Agrobacterium cavarae]|uniref:epoxide hydrolase family protein n=1 Tax=Agrobacterium cavarae TaxID=2528239 RepID=UPI003FD2F3EC